MKASSETRAEEPPAPTARGPRGRVAVAHAVVATLLVLGLLAAAWALQRTLGGGNLFIDTGDATSRVWRVVTRGGDLSSVTPESVLRDWFPPGHQVLNSWLFRLDPDADGPTFALRVQRMGLWAAWFSAACLGLATGRVAGPMWGALAAAAALSSNLVLSVAASGVSEVYGLLLTSVAAVPLAEAVLRRGRASLIAGVLAGCLLLLGTFFRHEVVIAAVAFGAGLLAVRRWPAGVATALIGSAYLVARTVDGRLRGDATLVNAVVDQYRYRGLGHAATSLWRRATELDPTVPLLWILLLGLSAALALAWWRRRRAGPENPDAAVPAADPDPDPAAQARAAAAGRFAVPLLLAGLGLAAVTLWLIGTRRLDYKDRYIVQVVPLLSAGGVVVLAALAERLHATRPRAVLAAVAACVVGVSLALPVALRDFRVAPMGNVITDAERELLAWLREHPADTRLYDTLSAREFRLVLYSHPGGSAREPWMYTRGVRDLPEPPGGWPASTEADRGARERASAEAFLAQEDPQQLILYSDRRHEKQGGRPRGTGLHHTDSYLRPDLRRTGRRSFVFDSSLPDGPRGLRYRVGFSSRDYLVLERVDPGG